MNKTKAPEKTNPGGYETVGRRKWFKVWAEDWLGGTSRFLLSHKQRAIWMDLLALAARSRFPGIIAPGMESGEMAGYPLRYLAGIVAVDDGELYEALDLFEQQDRISIAEDKNQSLVLTIRNWKRYQSDLDAQARRSRDYRARKKTGASRSVTGHRHARVTQRHGSRSRLDVDVDVEGDVEEAGAKATTAAASPKPEPENLAAWLAIGLEPTGTPEFRRTWEADFAAKLSGGSLVMAMEATASCCQERGTPVPPPFYKAKRRIEACGAEPEEGEPKEVVPAWKDGALWKK